MTYNLKPTTQFKKDVKLCNKRGYDMNLLKKVLKLLDKSSYKETYIRCFP